MKRIWMLAGVCLLTAALAVGVIACGDDDEDDDGNGGEPTAMETMADETPMDETPMEGETPEDVIGAEVTLLEVDGSGVTGMATLTENADGASTAVEVVIDGGLTEGPHQNHIHGPGTCESPADVEQALTELEADATGAATGETPAVPGALSTFTDGDNYVAIHATDGAVVACGNIPTM
jgi:hypothetical protein